MDLLKRIDPEVAAVLPGLPVLDLTDIPTARQALLDRRAVASAGLEPSPTVVRQDHFAPGLDGAPEVRVRHYRPAGRRACCRACTGSTAAVTSWARSSRTTWPWTTSWTRWAARSSRWSGAGRPSTRSRPRWTTATPGWPGRTATRPNSASTPPASRSAARARGAAWRRGSPSSPRRGELPVRFQLLIYPMLDDRNVNPASGAPTDPRVWTRTPNLIGWRAYLGDAAARIP